LDKEYRSTLSDRESSILSELSYKNKGIFSIDDIKKDIENPKNFLDKLIRKKWILKIRRGVYAIVPLDAGERGSSSYTLHSFVIASLLTDQYYIGYFSALNYHGLTEQIPSSVYIATPKFRHSRKILDTKFVFVTIPIRKMFGTVESTIESRKVKISSPEKTIVDCLDHPEHSGGVEEIAKSLYFARDEINPETLVKHAKKLGNSAVIKRLGYLAETMDWNECLELLNNVRIKSGYTILDPTIPHRDGKIKDRWNLLVNLKLDFERFIE